ncbi:MAG: hypothetical protein QMC78_06365 [Methanocellales archaeon]|nr:hypothetical protein [Methanocellales archaeon]
MRHSTRFIGCDGAVETTVGVILVIAIATTAIAAIYAVGMPMLSDARHNVNIQNAQHYFGIIQSDISDLKGPLSGVGPSRRTTINLGGGSIAIMPGAASYVQVNYDGSDVFGGTGLQVGKIEYTLEDDTIIYENGAVISRFSFGNPAITSRPSNMFIAPADDDNTIVHLRMIKLSGASSSTGGSGTAYIDSRFTGFDDDVIYSPDETTLRKTVTITITSEYYQAWERFFEDELSNAGLTSTQFEITSDAGAKQVVIEIDGKKPPGTPDIYLSVHETIIESSVS